MISITDKTRVIIPANFKGIDKQNINSSALNNTGDIFTQKVNDKGITKKLEDPSTVTLTTKPGVKYYFSTAVGDQMLRSGDTPLINPNKFWKSQRLSYKEVWDSAPAVQIAQNMMKELYDHGKSEVNDAKQWLHKEDIIKQKENAVDIKKYCEKNYKDIKDVIILSMGGNIGTMKMAATSVARRCDGNTITAENDVKFHFMDTIEPSRINDLKKLIKEKPNSTLVCMVSQSGSTYETLAMNMLLQQDQKDLSAGQKLPAKNTIIMVGKKDSAIGELAKHLHYNDDKIFDIPDWSKTGGRWTGNTAEPALIISLGGGNPVDWYQGYQDTIEDFLNTKKPNKNALFQSALLDIAYSKKNFKNFITLAYGDKLGGLSHALAQNVNESTPTLDGKKCPGLIHKFLIAPAAQHADMATLTEFGKHPLKLRILQVEKDKTLENEGMPETGIDFTKIFNGKIPKEYKELSKRAEGMNGLTPSQLMNCMAAATGHDIWKRGRPVEFVSIPEINEKTIASLLAEQYIRTMVWGQANKVDVTREMSFKSYKDVFGEMTSKISHKILDKGAPTIFFKYVTDVIKDFFGIDKK